jgi:hypothetical protein
MGSGMKDQLLTQDEQQQVVDFVKAKKYRYEGAIIRYIEKNFVDKEGGYQRLDPVYECARLVEHGPLYWIALDEEKVGSDRYSEAELRYRYASWKYPDFIADVIKEIYEVEENAVEKIVANLQEIGALLSKMHRRRKRGEAVEPILEALNKLGSRRPVRQRFSVHISRETGKFVVSVQSREHQLPKALEHAADEIRTATEKLK